MTVRVLVAAAPAAVVALGLAAAIGTKTPGESLVTLVVASLASGAVLLGALALVRIHLIGMTRDILRRDRPTVAPDA